MRVGQGFGRLAVGHDVLQRREAGVAREAVLIPDGVLSTYMITFLKQIFQNFSENVRRISEGYSNFFPEIIFVLAFISSKSLKFCRNVDENW